jgi:hypothetical protein
MYFGSFSMQVIALDEKSNPIRCKEVFSRRGKRAFPTPQPNSQNISGGLVGSLISSGNSLSK